MSDQYADKARALRQWASSSPDYTDSLAVTLGPCFTWTGGNKWSVRIERPRTTASGRKGKPEHVLTLIADSAEAVLRDLATMLDADGPTIADAEATP